MQFWSSHGPAYRTSDSACQQNDESSITGGGYFFLIENLFGMAAALLKVCCYLKLGEDRQVVVSGLNRFKVGVSTSLLSGEPTNCEVSSTVFNATFGRFSMLTDVSQLNQRPW